MLAYVHVPKTGGMSIRSHVQSRSNDKEKTIKYFGHVPISDEIKRKYTVVSCLRDPYDLFMSLYRFKLYHYTDDSRWKIQHMIDHVEQHGYRGYRNHWYKHNLPDIMLDFNHLQRDWNKLCVNHDLHELKQLPHLHCTKHVEYTSPTIDQQQQIRRLIEPDTELYQQLRRQF